MSRAIPTRTCVGCREHAAKADLIRVVVDASTGCAVVDEAGGRPGRGAHLHPSPACLALAERRRSLPRALRHEGRLDIEAVRRSIQDLGTLDQHEADGSTA